MSEYSRSALAILRNPQATMKWYVVPLFLLVLYLYTKLMQEKKRNVILGGLALWGMDLFNEIWNSIVFHATGFAPVWGTPGSAGDTTLLLLIGYNIEISFMFLLMGAAACLMLPEDPHKKLLGLPNRAVYAAALTTLSVCVECFLNWCGLLTWEYPWWSRSCPWLIWLIGYLPFFTIAFAVHDMKEKKHQRWTLGVLFGVDLICLIVFGAIGWM